MKILIRRRNLLVASDLGLHMSSIKDARLVWDNRLTTVDKFEIEVVCYRLRRQESNIQSLLQNI